MGCRVQKKKLLCIDREMVTGTSFLQNNIAILNVIKKKYINPLDLVILSPEIHVSNWSLIYNIPPPSVLIFTSVFFCFVNAGEGLLLILKLKKSYKLISHYNYPVFFTGVDWDRHCPFTLLMMLLDTRATQALPAFPVLLLLNFKGILPWGSFS